MEASAADPMQRALQTFLEQGVLGAVCVLLIGAVVYLNRALQKSHADRVGDQKAYADTLQATNSKTQDLIIELNQTNLLAKVATVSLEKSVDELRGEVAELKDQQVHLTAALRAKVKQ